MACEYGRRRGRSSAQNSAGWDPATSLVVLRVRSLAFRCAAERDAAARRPPGLALGRSWSNALTATTGIVSVIGGPLPTGRGRSIERVIRTNAQMHGGFAGGALIDAAGTVIGI